MLRFAISADDQESAEAIAHALRVAGFDTELQPQPDSGWVVSATPTAPIDIDEAPRRMRELAAEHGGAYIGHGGSLTISR